MKFKDDDDHAFYEVMMTGEADYLISGNLSHFPEHKKFKSSCEFVTKYKNRN
jgi:predicted nucleic acid-binding protein